MLFQNLTTTRQHALIFPPA